MTWLLIPISYLAIGNFVHEPVSLFRALVITLIAGLLIATLKKIRLQNQLLTVLPYLMFFGYLISTLMNGENFAQALIGGYQRNYGLLLVLSLALIFSYFTSRGESVIRQFEYSVWLVIGISIIYGALQVLNKDPLPWVNPYKAVQLTLGNPNFAGAFIGMVFVFAIYRILKSKNFWSKALFIIISLALIFISWQTKSLQGLLLIIAASLCYVFFLTIKGSNKKEKLTRNSVIGISALSILLIAFIFISNLEFLKSIREKFYFQGSIGQRLDYWRTGLKIFASHPIFGVGPDQYSRYAAEYRSASQVIRDGAFVIPDKSHNVLIDQFANGGLIVGLIWIAFVIGVFISLIKLLKSTENREKTLIYAAIGTVWTTYVLQSLISPDQLVLTVLGYSAAGIIVGVNYSVNPSKKEIKWLGFLERDSFYWRIAAVLFLALSVGTFGKALAMDAKVKTVLADTSVSPDQILDAVNTFPEPKTIEQIAIKVGQSENKCDLTNKLADRLLSVDSRSSQGWYIRAVCESQKNNQAKALEYVQTSLKFDPMNSVFLVGEAKLAIGSNNLAVARKAAAKIKANYPNDPALKQIEEFLATAK